MVRTVAMRLQVDHVTVCGSDLAPMRRAFGAVGLTTTYGGPHANGVTHMDLLTFGDGSYLELIAPMAQLKGASGMMAGWARLMEGDAGAGAWAVRSDDIHAEAARLRAAGIEVRGPEAGGRRRPYGAALEWQTAIVGEGPAGSVLPFVIQDKTARNLRVPAAAASRELEGVALVVIGVRNLDRSADLFQRAFGWSAPVIEDHAKFGGVLAHFAGTPVVIAAASNTQSWLHQRLKRFGEGPVAFVLGARAKDAESYELGNPEMWFGQKLAWFDEGRLRGARVGVVEI